MSTGIQFTIRGRVSWGFGGIRKADNLLVKGCAWKIGSGIKVLVGRDKWLDGRIPVFSSNVCLSGARSWKVRDFMLLHPRRWDAAKVRLSFEKKDVRNILSMELPAGEENDLLYWPRQQSGILTIKSAYAILSALDECSLPRDTPQSSTGFFKTLWSLLIPPKWKSFIWRILTGSLATCTTLRSRGIQIDTSCSECGQQGEDTQHIFRLCSLAQQVWMCGSLGIHANHDENLSTRIGFSIMSDFLSARMEGRSEDALFYLYHVGTMYYEEQHDFSRPKQTS